MIVHDCNGKSYSKWQSLYWCGRKLECWSLISCKWSNLLQKCHKCFVCFTASNTGTRKWRRTTECRQTFRPLGHRGQLSPIQIQNARRQFNAVYRSSTHRWSCLSENRQMLSVRWQPTNHHHRTYPTCWRSNPTVIGKMAASRSWVRSRDWPTRVHLTHRRRRFESAVMSSVSWINRVYRQTYPRISRSRWMRNRCLRYTYE